MHSSGVSASSRFSSISKSASLSDMHQAWASAKITSTLLASYKVGGGGGGGGSGGGGGVTQGRELRVAVVAQCERGRRFISKDDGAWCVQGVGG